MNEFKEMSDLNDKKSVKPKQMKINLAALSGVNLPQEIKIHLPDQVTTNQIRASLLCNNQKAGCMLTLLGENFGNHIKFYIASHDEKIDKSNNMPEIYRSIPSRALASFEIGSKSKNPHISSLFNKDSSKTFVDIFTAMKNKIVGELIADMPALDEERLASYITSFSEQGISSNHVVPSKYSFERVTVNSDDGRAVSLDIVSKKVKSDEGDVSYERYVVWPLTSKDDEFVEKKLRFPLGKIASIPASSNFLKQSHESDVIKLRKAMLAATKVNGMISFYSNPATSEVGLQATLESEFPEFVLVSAPKRNNVANGYSGKIGQDYTTNMGSSGASAGKFTVVDKDGNESDADLASEAETPLSFFMLALNKMDLIDVQILGKENYQTRFNIQNKKDALKSIKMKTASIEQIQRLVSFGGNIPSRFRPALGMNITNSENYARGRNFINKLIDSGIISYNGDLKTARNKIYNDCMAIIQSEFASIDLSAINVAGATSSEAYKHPVYKTSVDGNYDKVKEIVRFRGLSEQVISKAINQGSLGDVHFKGRKVAGKNSTNVSAVANLNYLNDLSKMRSHQEYWLKEGKVAKMFFGAASTHGVGFTLASSKPEPEAVLLTESVFDAMAAYDVTAKSGLDPEAYTYTSVMSSGYLPSWLSEASNGFRPPTESESNENAKAGIVHAVYRDVLVESEPLDLDKSIQVIKSSFDDFDKKIFLSDGSKESSEALNQLKSVLRYAGIEDELAIYKDYASYYRPPSKNGDRKANAIFNVSNVDQFIDKLGVKFDNNGTVVHLVAKTKKSYPVTEPSELLEAKENMENNLKSKKIILGFDADYPGYKWATPFINYMKAIGYDHNVLSLPPLSVKDSQMNAHDVLSLLEANKSNPTSLKDKFTPSDLVNDINDAARYLLREDAAPHQREQIVRSFTAAFARSMTDRTESFVASYTSAMKSLNGYTTALKNLEKKAPNNSRSPTRQRSAA